MNKFDNVKIPVFGQDLDSFDTMTGTAKPDNKGVFYSDDAWLSDLNNTRIFGVVEGVARSIDYNTVMRQCSVFASLFANVLAYRNSQTRQGSVVYGGSTSALIGTNILDGEGTIEGHILALADLFTINNFLMDKEVTTRTINDSAVTTAKLAANAVISEKIANESITKNKLSSGLIDTGSASANGITVSLKQTDKANERGFVIGLTSSKVTNASNSDKATNSTNSDNVKVSPTAETFYLCGSSSVGNGGQQAVVNNSSIYVTSGGQLNASSFNVVSDRSFKENIEDVGHNQVRKLVEGVDVKTFNYKNNPDFSVLGMVAQDIQDVGSVLGDLLVEKNKDTGKLSLRESKLVYVLWDYVKQQNERIKKLELAIESLSRG